MRLPMQAIQCIAGLALAGASPALAADRVALVIGNAAYQHTSELRNPANDAADIGAALERLGFEVLRGIDLDHDGMLDDARRFAAALAGAKIALFFYAGHGLQVDGVNYLVPVDAALSSESDLDFAAVRLDLVLRQMEREATTSIVFLDACRDSPLAGNLSRSMGTRSASIGRGLARVESGVGTMIAFATQPGNVALDGDGRNSPFTAALLQTIEKPGLDLSDVMIEVRNAVLSATDGKQVPWEHSSLTGRVYFTAPPAPSAGGTGTEEATEKAIELAFWNSIQGSANPRLFESYLSRYPDGAFSELAKLKMEDLGAPPAVTPDTARDDTTPVTDPKEIAEIQSQLYELNYDPGSADGVAGTRTREAIGEFQKNAGMEPDGQATLGLLERLRSLGGLKPWGAIAYSQTRQDWGMSWSAETRKQAIAEAQSSCDKKGRCEAELSFFGTECGAFAHSSSGWAIVARPTLAEARKAALDQCRGSCRVVATVCADGAEKQVAAD